MPSILIVDDEQSICWGLTRLGKSLGHEVVAASSAEQALKLVRHQKPDVVVLDVRLPGMDGLTAIERFQMECGSVPIIIITAYGDLRTAVDAIRGGAFDYIAKPFDVEKVKHALVRALASQPGTETAAYPLQVEGMVGRSPAMQEVYKQIALAASSDASVLLIGESGSGKDLAARAIHRFSRRCNGPFVAVNLASLPPTVAETELLGTQSQSDSFPDSPRAGLLAQAQGGTLYLDEIADIPESLQVTLLRALEHGEVVPVGGNVPVRCDFHIISATRRDIASLAVGGSFRYELLYKLSALKINLPPLRSRVQDIADLSDYFSATLGNVLGDSRAAITPAAMEELQQREWRGNVRELRSVIEYAIARSRGRSITPEHLPPAMPPNIFQRESVGSSSDILEAVRKWTLNEVNNDELDGRLYERLLQIVEPPLLEVTLKHHFGQCASAARQLGIHRTTLRKKLTDHGIESDGP